MNYFEQFIKLTFIWPTHHKLQINLKGKNKKSQITSLDQATSTTKASDLEISPAIYSVNNYLKVVKSIAKLLRSIERILGSSYIDIHVFKAEFISKFRGSTVI